jgi:hypothetical protein
MSRAERERRMNELARIRAQIITMAEQHDQAMAVITVDEELWRTEFSDELALLLEIDAYVKKTAQRGLEARQSK